jgi:hypothetical protein
MLATVNVDYKYAFSSSLTTELTSRRNLQLATSGGIESNPYFFSGRLTSPKQTADLLLALSAISRTRFFSPGELRERMLAAADPVVTSDGERLRFEVFSVCCGCYARLDLDNNAVDGDWIGKGTTNVDFNPSMRVALASVMNSENVALKIGADRVEIERAGQSVVEKKVKLPVRWLKGFVEVQVYQSSLTPTLEVPALELSKQLRILPQQNITQTGTVTYLVPAGKSLRLSQRTVPGAIGVGAISRLKTIEPMLRYAKTVRIYSNDYNVSAFELILANGSFFFVLSPNAARGFSGEGQALQGLAEKTSSQVLAQVKAALVWQAKINCKELGDSLGLERNAVLAALQMLGARGLVGYDLSSGGFFHRELPFDLGLIEELHPRMKKARKLIEENKVRLKTGDAGAGEAFVAGKTSEHFVQFTLEGSRCTCDWFAKNQGDRGPCSHILAAELAMQEVTPR